MRDATREKLAKVRENVLKEAREVRLLQLGQSIDAAETIAMNNAARYLENAAMYLAEALES